MRSRIALLALAVLFFEGCAGSRARLGVLFAPPCPPPRDANDTCALENDVERTYWVAYINGPTFCRCPDKPVSPQ